MGTGPESVFWGGRRARWAAGLAVLALAALAGAWVSQGLRTRAAIREAYPQQSGRIEVAGLERALRIDRDSRGIPHVDAASERDAFFALGFCHAQDRLAQLFTLRRRARGTAAEVMGSEALAGDRVARLIDFAGLAERQWGSLPSAARRVLEAYAEGVNARIVRFEAIADPSGSVGSRPLETWRPEDSLAVWKLFGWGLAESVDASLVLNELVAGLGAVDARRFFPARSRTSDPAGRTTARVPAWVGEGVRTLRGAAGLAGHGVGSTAFVVGGAHTESGRPVLVADSHFEPTAPAALYLAHLRAPGLDVAGASLPGVPVFWWGRNPSLAWAAVNAGAVVTDLYTETVRKEGTEYHDGRRWQPLAERRERLAVRGGTAATLAVRETSRGPLLPAVSEGAREALSVAWTGARTGGTSGIGSLLGVARARNGEALRAALQTHHEPAIAVIWAESSGAAGLQVAGWIPHRTLSSQMLPLPGRARWYAWDEPIAFDALPAERLADGKGFLIAADQSFQSSDEDAPIDSMWRSGARRARLEALLREAIRGGTDLRELAALTSDVGLDRSRTLVETALALAGDSLRAQEARELARLLGDWDGMAAPESVGATTYHAFLDALAGALFADRVGPELFERYLALSALDLEALVLQVLTDAASGGAGDPWSEPARVRAAVVASLRETWLSLSFRLGPDPRRWAWGPVHALGFRSLDGSRSRLGPFPYGGAPHAVHVGDYSLTDPFAVRVAATARFAIDAGSLDLAMVALAPGQSEYPGHAHYQDGVREWLTGRFSLLATRRLEVEDRSVARLLLEPLD